MDSLIIFDWLSFTTKEHGTGSVMAMMGLYDLPWVDGKGARGYLNRLYYDGISIHHGGRDEIWIEMTGQGCRAFESNSTLGWSGLFDEIIHDDDYHVTRFDVALDDHESLLDLDVMHAACIRGDWVSKFEFWDARMSSKGTTIYHGSPTSDLRFRIYDKAAERNCRDEGHWVRFEMQLRDDRAAQFIRMIAGAPVGQVFAGVINNYLRYVDPVTASGRRRTDMRRRWPTMDYWQRFVGAAAAISLYTAPGTEYNLDRLKRYAVDQAGSAAAAYIQINGLDDYLDSIEKQYYKVKNPKHMDLVQKMVYDRVDD